jgi:hypothetical protein
MRIIRHSVSTGVIAITANGNPNTGANTEKVANTDSGSIFASAASENKALVIKLRIAV